LSFFFESENLESNIFVSTLFIGKVPELSEINSEVFLKGNPVIEEMKWAWI